MIAQVPAIADPGTAELPWPATCDGVAEGEAVSWKRSLQLGIVMADPGKAYQHLSGGPSSYAQTGAVRL